MPTIFVVVQIDKLANMAIDLMVDEKAQAVELDIVRHSTAHLLAHAVKDLFPGAQPVIGPVIEDGFFYDFHYPKGFVEADLVAIEAKMQVLAKTDLEIVPEEWNRQQAIEYFTSIGETYKVKIIETIPDTERLTVYRQGDFVDLCRGPHVQSTGKLQAFKLTKLSGSYWLGDAKNESLQRIYGTAWLSKQDLTDYLLRLEKAKQRDHRLLGRKMDLFHLQDEAPGMVFWHPDGWAIYKEIKQYISAQLLKFGYQEINTPLLLDRSLWEKSGHWEKFDNGMFTAESENRTYALKPMNCPGHIQVFKQGVKSYRDLPIRYAEFGCCHRNEASGTLHGILRVRNFVQDDGHIFCTEDQIHSESSAYIDQLRKIYADFGFNDIIVKLSTRPAQRIGADELWDKAETALANVLDSKEMVWRESPGEGAFYGPKIEFSLRDSLGRVWQCGTLQVDFSMAERLGAHYIDEAGMKKSPVILHRAVLGALERFIGILLEETGGDLPLWLAPVQAVVVNITDKQINYALQLTEKLRSCGFRVNSDLRNEKVNFKIREHSIKRVPYLLIVGDREIEAGAVTVRTREGQDLGSISIDNLINLLTEQKLKYC